jgi:hypothetical protein
MNGRRLCHRGQQSHDESRCETFPVIATRRRSGGAAHVGGALLAFGSARRWPSSCSAKSSSSPIVISEPEDDRIDFTSAWLASRPRTAFNATRAVSAFAMYTFGVTREYSMEKGMMSPCARRQGYQRDRGGASSCPHPIRRSALPSPASWGRGSPRPPIYALSSNCSDRFSRGV